MKCLVACLVALCAASPSRADDQIGGISIDASRLGAGLPHAAAAATRVEPRAPRVTAVLAASAEPAVRPQVERAYELMLSEYERAIAKAGLARNDVAVAAAMYVSCAYRAYRGAQVSDAAFAAVVTQMRDALAATPEFADAPMAKKQDMYEGMAITAALLAASAKSKPGTDASRATVRAALESFLRTSADSIELTDRGLAVTASATPAGTRAAPPPSPTPASEPASSDRPFPSSSVEALLWSFEIRYEAFPANSMVAKESIYLLLTDGTCTDRVPATLVGFDPAKDRAEHPRSSCTWRKKAGAYEIGHDGRFAAIPRVTVLRGARRGEHLAGTWKRQKTSTVGTASTWRGTQLVLGADGRFELASAGAWQTGTSLNRPDGEITITGSYDDKGSQTTLSGNHSGGSVRTSTGRTAADQSGTYTLDGYALELHYDSGRIERHMFGIGSDSAHTFVRLDGTIMTKK